MALRGSRDQFPAHRQLPFDAQDAHRLSCELGEYLMADAPTERLVTALDDAGRSVTVYALTEHSCVVRLETPVGHLRFFEVPRDRIGATTDRLRESDWENADSGA